MARILVIDDNQQLRAMLGRYFRRRGHEVLEAADGAEGLALYRSQGAELVVTDLIMPDKEGLDTILELREESAEVPIIAVSGGGRIPPGEYLRMARTVGADEVFSKPVKLDALAAVVDRLLA